MKKSKPKSASEKRNHGKIFYDIKSPILRALHERYYAGGVLSMLDANQLNELAVLATKAVMMNESVRISKKRIK